jgi:hypothetical protein
MKTAALLALLMTLAGLTADAQKTSQTNLKDSLLWMHKFVADKGFQDLRQSAVETLECAPGSANCRLRRDVSTFDADGCSATITRSVSLNAKDSGTYTYRVSLRDLDSDSVLATEDQPLANVVWARAVRGTQSVTEAFRPPPGAAPGKDWQGTRSWVELVFDNPDDAKRFAAVLQHAIQLCSAKRR